VRYPSKAYLLVGGVPGLVLHGDDFGSPNRTKLGTLMLLLFQMFREHCFVVPAPRTKHVKDPLQSFTVHSMRSDGGRKQAGDSGGSSANSGR
jgi:hypothetical protein